MCAVSSPAAALRLVHSASELEASPPQFAVDWTTIDPAVFGISVPTDSSTPAPRISRNLAIQVPAVKAARDKIAGVLGTLPIAVRNAAKVEVRSALLEQPEANVPRSVTMTRLYEDLLFESIAWWTVKSRDWTGYPAKVKREAPRDVTVDNNARAGSCGDPTCSAAVMVRGRHVHDRDVIRFDSPTDGLLIAGARAIRTLLLLDQAAANGANGIPPVDYFTPTDGADPADDTDVEAILTEWAEVRQARRTGYIPAALDYHTNAGWSPEQLQLADMRQHAVLEIARLTTLDAEELGVSVTSRTYTNMFDRRKSYVDFTLGMYRAAAEDRLSMGDVTPYGQFVRHNLSAFLRSDDLTRMQVYAAGQAVGVYGKDEPRAIEDRPPLDPADDPRQENPA